MLNLEADLEIQLHARPQLQGAAEEFVKAQNLPLPASLDWPTPEEVLSNQEELNLAEANQAWTQATASVEVETVEFHTPHLVSKVTTMETRKLFWANSGPVEPDNYEFNEPDLAPPELESAQTEWQEAEAVPSEIPYLWHYLIPAVPTGLLTVAVNAFSTKEIRGQRPLRWHSAFDPILEAPRLWAAHEAWARAEATGKVIKVDFHPINLQLPNFSAARNAWMMAEAMVTKPRPDLIPYSGGIVVIANPRDVTKKELARCRPERLIETESLAGTLHRRADAYPRRKARRERKELAGRRPPEGKAMMVGSWVVSRTFSKERRRMEANYIQHPWPVLWDRAQGIQKVAQRLLQKETRWVTTRIYVSALERHLDNQERIIERFNGFLVTTDFHKPWWMDGQPNMSSEFGVALQREAEQLEQQYRGNSGNPYLLEKIVDPWQPPKKREERKAEDKPKEEDESCKVKSLALQMFPWLDVAPARPARNRSKSKTKAKR